MAICTSQCWVEVSGQALLAWAEVSGQTLLAWAEVSGQALLPCFTAFLPSLSHPLPLP